MGRTRVIKQERGCLSTSAPEVTENKCDASTAVTHTNIPADVTMTSCQESCVGNACNNRVWPNRVKCLRTDNGAVSTAANAAGIALTSNADNVVKPCPSPADDTCYIAEYNFMTPSSHYHRTTEGTFNYIGAGTDLGFSPTVYRGCTIGSENIYQTGCNKQGARGTDGRLKYEYFESCNFTCANDGCNFGSAYSGSFMQLVSPIVMVLAFAFKNL